MRILNPPMPTTLLAQLRAFVDKHRRTIIRLLDLLIFIEFLMILLEVVLWIGVFAR